MKMTRVIHEISMKISSIHLPKSERGRTVVIGLSHRLQPHDDASRSDGDEEEHGPDSERSERALGHGGRRVLPVSWGAGRGRPRRAPAPGTAAADGRPLEVEHGHPAPGRQERARSRPGCTSTGARCAPARPAATARVDSAARRPESPPEAPGTGSGRRPAAGAGWWTQPLLSSSRRYPPRSLLYRERKPSGMIHMRLPGGRDRAAAQPARSSSVWSSTLPPRSMSFQSLISSGRWLRPPIDGMNSMPEGVTSRGSGRRAPPPTASAGTEPERRARPLDRAHHPRRAARGLGARQRLDARRGAPAAARPRGRAPGTRDRGGRGSRASSSRISCSSTARAGTMLDTPGGDLDAAEVGDAPAAALPDDVLARLERVLGGGEERVLPPRHRGRAGVVGLADEGEAVAADADDALDHADRDARGLEVRPLLDVELDVGRRASSGSHLAFGASSASKPARVIASTSRSPSTAGSRGSASDRACPVKPREPKRPP